MKHKTGVKKIQITSTNVDNYIRDRKRAGHKKIFWNKVEWDIFSNFFAAATGCGIGLEINIPAMNSCSKHHNHKPKSGVLFMGIKNYRRK